MKILSVLIAMLCHTAIAAPDEDALGKSAGYPLPKTIKFPWADQYKVAVFSNREKLSRHCTIQPSSTPLALRVAGSEPSSRYTYQNQNFDLNDYFERRRVTGFIVLKDDEILIERYAYERNATHRMLSASMVKSVVGLAIGQALAQGSIKSLDDTAAKYVPKLSESAYGQTKIINLLRMSSGVKFVENYSGNDDLAKFNRLVSQNSIIDALNSFVEKEFDEGAKFKYSSLETHVLAQVIQSATGMGICEYVEKNVWQPIGAEGAATWIYTNRKNEISASGEFNATIRDYARLGYAFANDGVVNGKQIFDKEYLFNMTDARRQPRAFWPKGATPLYGYGFQIWLLDSPTGKRRFFLQGIYGQAIFVDPENKLVMVQTVVEKAPGGTGIIVEGEAVFQGLVRKYGRW